MKHSRQCFIGYPNTSNFGKNTPLRAVFSTLLSVFGYPDKTLSLVFAILLKDLELNIYKAFTKLHYQPHVRLLEMTPFCLPRSRWMGRMYQQLSKCCLSTESWTCPWDQLTVQRLWNLAWSTRLAAISMVSWHATTVNHVMCLLLSRP